MKLGGLKKVLKIFNRLVIKFKLTSDINNIILL